MLARLRKTGRSDEGASAIEYGLLVAAIAAVIVVVIGTLGVLVRSNFEHTQSCVSTGGAAAGC